MVLFKYQDDGTGTQGEGSSGSRSNGTARKPLKTMIGDIDAEEYDMQAALEVEQADHEDGWEPHQHLYDDSAAARVNSAKAASLAKRRQPQASTSVKKAQPVVELDDDGDDDSDMDMIPVAIDAGGSVVSDARIEEISREIDSIDEQIASLRAARAILAEDRQSLLNQQRAAQTIIREKQGRANYTKPHSSVRTVNYAESGQFPWKKKLDGLLDRVFGIKKLRLCQEGVLNAVLDGRDVICIMPTGGGKSVCFQAPALMSTGVTLVISPLLSLMADQVLALKAKGVDAVMITGSTPHAEIKEITERLTSPNGSIKLCYVTPEKLAKSKTFANTLGKMYSNGLLSRIAIDESHCCSQMGHDFRPDYKRLSMLKQLYPNTPIIALTATCGKAVLNDVVRILHLKSCTSGETAEPNKTVFFSAPLYRPNLNYSVRLKPVQAPNLALEMAELILQKYPHSAGIIYCLSQKETETFAQAIRDASDGQIKIGTYHAGMGDYDKERIHTRWREGKIKCVVATIAFGMGIDAPDVRYVFHQTISKSMEGYYQETGRAGRDGNNSDCILWFRPADATRLSTLTLGEVEGQKKLHIMLKYALDFMSCRKLLFDSYFGNPANVVAPYAESDRSPCGHCDNCIRSRMLSSEDQEGQTSAELDDAAPLRESTANEYASKHQILTRDVTMEAWKICKIIKAADALSSRITLPGAADLCRGLSKCTFLTKNKDVKASINLDQVCNGKITTISKDDMEILLLELLLQGYLKEEFVQTAYTINSYIVTGPQSIRLGRLGEEQVNESGIKIELSTLTTLKSNKRKGKKGRTNGTAQGHEEDGSTEGKDENQNTRKPTKKRSSSKDPNGEHTTEAVADKGKGSKWAIANDKPPIRKKKMEEPLHGPDQTETSRKRRKKTLTDSDDEDWEDFGLGSTKGKGKQGHRPNEPDGYEEDTGPNSETMDIPSDTAGFDQSDDAESGAEEPTTSAYPFMRDRFSKKRGPTESARSRAASAALHRNNDGVGAGSRDRRVIDLDSYD